MHSIIIVIDVKILLYKSLKDTHKKLLRVSDHMGSETCCSNFLCVSFRLLYNKILTSTTVIIECISWSINVIDHNDARWRPVNTLKPFIIIFSVHISPLNLYISLHTMV